MKHCMSQAHSIIEWSAVKNDMILKKMELGGQDKDTSHNNVGVIEMLEGRLECPGWRHLT